MDALDLSPLQTVALILLLWVTAVAVSRALHLERRGLEAHPLYMIYRSRRINSLLERVAAWSPPFSLHPG